MRGDRLLRILREASIRLPGGHIPDALIPAVQGCCSAATTHSYDLSPLFWKEIELVGAINHSFDPGPGGGPTRHSVARAVDIRLRGACPTRSS